MALNHETNPQREAGDGNPILRLGQMGACWKLLREATQRCNVACRAHERPRHFFRVGIDVAGRDVGKAVKVDFFPGKGAVDGGALGSRLFQNVVMNVSEQVIDFEIRLFDVVQQRARVRTVATRTVAGGGTRGCGKRNQHVIVDLDRREAARCDLDRSSRCSGCFRVLLFGIAGAAVCK